MSSVNITDQERSIMATEIRKTVHGLETTEFNLDPLVPRNASIATSRISSAFKRHGTLLQKALAVAIETCTDVQVWNERQLTHPDYKNGLNIDLIIYDNNARSLDIFEIKRGLGSHDSDAKKGINKRLDAARASASQLSLPYKDMHTYVVSYYGTRMNTKRHTKLSKSDIDIKYGAGVSRFVDEVDDYYKSKLHSIVSKNFLAALREFDVEISQAADENRTKRIETKHPWDALGI